MVKFVYRQALVARLKELVRTSSRIISSALLVVSCVLSVNANAQHKPNLVFSYKDLSAMQQAINQNGSFAKAYYALKQRVDGQMSQPIDVPVPADGGGGYTHERHKKNYQLMLNAGKVYQLSGDVKYADFVKAMLLEYAALYPTLGLHPKRKVKSQNPGKFFWQSLNEAVWLVYTIQAYDLILGSLNESDATIIEQQLLRPVVTFLSAGQPSTFNKVHNHGTWAVAGVGMAGYVLNEPQWVEQALYDLSLSGKGGFLRQLEQLFSPQGYYNEGPYYQRYALMPFVTFAKAIENNEPERKIFAYRGGVLLNAITTTIELSYNGLFFGINDAIKSKGIDTIELVHGVTLAYGLTQNTGLLDIASQQRQIIMTGDGLRVSEAIDAGLATPYQYRSTAFGDGANGDEGALVVMRAGDASDQALVYKPAAQGLGHGHFDKLSWQFFDGGAEIVSDYGAARFLNVEAKYGGRYLPENKSYAKQTVAHNTVVVDEQSHFDANTRVGNKHHPKLHFFEQNTDGVVSQASIDSAYQGVTLTRTMALVSIPELEEALAFDIFNVLSEQAHQYDLPLHYQGQLIETNFNVNANTNTLKPLGKNNGYQHLWLTGSAQPEAGVAQVTWLNDNGRFYTQSALVDGQTQAIFTRIGANDPNANMRSETGFIYRKSAAKEHTFVSVLEPHGEYNPSKEYTVLAKTRVATLNYEQKDGIDLVLLGLHNGLKYLVAINARTTTKTKTNLRYEGVDYPLEHRLTLIALHNQH